MGLSPTSSGIVPAPNGRPIRERAASCSSPPTQPPWCCAVARGEKINLQVRKVLLGNEAPCIIIREFFTTVREGSSPKEELPSPLDSTHITSHRRRDRHRCPRRNPNPHLGGGTSESDMQRHGHGGTHTEVLGVAVGHNKRASEAHE